METKEYILTNATELFNRQGFTASSLRQTAAYLDMSDGNLRYHFSSKEMLVMDIFRQMKQELEFMFEPANPGSEKLQLEELHQQFRAVFFTMYRYKFLFIETPLLVQQYPAFKKLYQALKRAHKAFIKTAVRALSKGQAPTSQLSARREEQLAEQLFIISDSWIRYVELEGLASPRSIDARIDHYVQLCLELIPLPQQTAAG
ncbi:TetR/AcrR family transcriptional regulator [Cesiribacter andamanensis]|nr:TetR/AcrR family transcriptional regulator [Cesiribacter andamanensis]